MSAAQFRRVIDNWIDQGRAAGYQISYDDRETFGFPRRITMRLTNIHWKTADGIDFRADAMDLIATPWDWKNFDAKFKNHVAVTTPLDDQGHALILSSASGRAHARLDQDGVWREAHLALNDTRAGLAPNYLFEAERLNASISRPDTPPKDHTQVGLTIDGEADAITLPPAMPSPFGDKATKFAAHLRVMGSVPDVRIRAAVDAWNKDSGVVEFDSFALQWGTLSLAAKGTVGFDDDLQPEGAFGGTVAEPQKTFQAFVDHGFIAMHDKTMLTSAMELFAKPGAHDGQGMELPITVQLGGLFFGPIRIFTFPEIEWPVAPPQG